SVDYNSSIRSSIMRIASIVSLGAAFLFVSRPSPAQPVEVTHLNGLVTIHCKDAALSSVFEQIEAATGIELTLEDEVKSKRLTANLEGVPVALAVSRLLEGAGVNYIVMMDPSDWERVDKIFVGGGGGGASRAAAGPARAPVFEEPAEEAYEEAPESFEEGMDGMDAGDMGDAMDPGLEAAPEDMLPDEFGAGQDPSEVEGPPGSSPAQEFLPPTQQFPRSSFTPGLPRGNQRNNQNSFQSGFGQQQPFGQQQQPFGQPQPFQEDPNQEGVMPFTDPFGRPIPVPPGMNNPQQTQQQRRQQHQQQQQE
ncbi:MAG TPA: hypothetical protein VJ921_05730, partial [Vicinamibacteria bacterium]|nr:hypothetical protein [Vicinamibacteria bacterium]